MTKKTLTPSQAEGPFYPTHYRQLQDNTLIHPNGIDELPQPIILVGQVTDRYGTPLENMAIEIWQADHNGRYNHPNDKNPAPVNLNFKYWAQTVTNTQGIYHFTTIKPALYNDDGDWRTPHIHFKLYKKRPKSVLTTQLYFLGEALNAQDNHLSSLPENLQTLLLTEPEKKAQQYGFNHNEIVYPFDIVLSE